MDNIIVYDKVSQAEQHLNKLPFIFKIGDQKYSKKYLEEWQKREYLKTAKLLNHHFSTQLNVDKSTPFLILKKEVVLAKMVIGSEKFLSKLAYQFKMANLISKIGTMTTSNKRKVSVADIYLKNSRLNAQEVMNELENMLLGNSEESNFYNYKANPNHFYSYGSNNDQTVVEMTGGTRVPNKFTLFYGDNTGLITPKNDDFKFEISGTGKLDDGTIVGGVRHLITDEINGTLHARLQVEFPAVIPNFFIHQHAIHLLVEFSNWITDVDLKKS